MITGIIIYLVCVYGWLAYEIKQSKFDSDEETN